MEAPDRDDAESLREMLRDLERAKVQEHEARLVSEQMVACLRAFTIHRAPEQIVPDLLMAMKPVIGYEDAFLLTPGEDGWLNVAFATSERLVATRWRSDGLFARVFPDKPIALFNVTAVPEWQAHGDVVVAGIRSALHIALRDQRRPAFLVCCHSTIGFFAQRHLRLAASFAPLASQALETLEHTQELRRINAALLREMEGRRAAEAERTRLGYAVEQAAEAIVITDAMGVIQYVNPAFERVTGYSRSEAIGGTPRILKSGAHDPDFYGAMWQRLIAGDVWSGRIVNRSKDGKLVHVEATISPVRDEMERVVMFVAVERDVTRMLDMEEQLRQAQKLESIGQLAAGIAHEINTPIQFIGDNLRFLADAHHTLKAIRDAHRHAIVEHRQAITAEVIERIDELDRRYDAEYLNAEVPKAIAQSLDGVARVADIVRAMKSFSHTDTEGMTPIDLNAAIQTTMAIARSEYKYVADIVTDLDGTLPLVPCHAGGIHQVLLNLLVNAAHAIADVVTPSGSRGTITIQTKREGSYAMISVADTGTGIPAEVQSKIFTPFFTTKAVGKGTGQGLSLARTIVVKQHRGRIEFVTADGRGTTFTVHVPLAGPLVAEHSTPDDPSAGDLPRSWTPSQLPDR